MTRQRKYDWDNLLRDVEGETLKDKFLNLYKVEGSIERMAHVLHVGHAALKSEYYRRVGNDHKPVARHIEWVSKLKDYEGETLRDKLSTAYKKFGKDMVLMAKELGVSYGIIKYKLKFLNIYQPKRENVVALYHNGFQPREMFNYRNYLEDVFSGYGDVKEIQEHLRKNPVYTNDELMAVLNNFKNASQTANFAN